MGEVKNIYTGMIAPSDPRLPEPQRAMFEATPDCMKILSVDGSVLMMNRAGCLALNVPLDSEFGMPWLPLLAEGVRAGGLAALQKARAGETIRFSGESGSPTGPVFWDNLLIPIKSDAGEVLSIFCVSRDVTEQRLAEKELEESMNREQLLAREMQHRVKNLFSVVTGLISFSEKEARLTDSTASATAVLREKIAALARASDAVFARGPLDRTDPYVEAIISSVLEPYGDQCRLGGPSVSIDRDEVTNLALVIHELATNSVKYGALSVSEGVVTVSWQMDGDFLDFGWVEAGGPQISDAPKHTGFGSDMVDRLLLSMGGAIDRQWLGGGLAVRGRMPRVFRK